MKPRIPTLLAVVAGLMCILPGCSKKESSSLKPQGAAPVQVFRLGNGTELQDLDPQIVTGVTEFRVMSALLEGLVAYDPKDLHTVPGVAESWDVTPDQLRYTFHLRANAKWSNGDPVTAQDFVRSYRRILAPSLAAEYAYMLYVVTNAEAFNKGGLKNFDEVGFKALDNRTLQVQLNAPTPYFLSLLNHHSWFPVHIPTVEKNGSLYERGNRWTRPGVFVGNGPFTLAEWKQNQVIVAKKNPTYWDAATVKLEEIHFFPIESDDTEERAFRSGQIDATYQLPLSKIDVYKRSSPELLRIDDNFGTYFYRLNVTKPPLNDKRVRQALALSLDRKAIVERITRAGQKPAYSFTPPIAGVYSSEPLFAQDPDKARKLLAEAGFPGGKGLPRIEILFNTLESHRTIAEAIQQMWKKELSIDVQLQNQEWKVYLDSQRQLNYQVCRAGWNGDYLDPNSFMDMLVTGGGNNQTGWSNAEYDRLIKEAGVTADLEKRKGIFRKAEALMMDEMPVIPIYFYVRDYLVRPNVKGWYPNILDIHPYKDIRLE